MTKRFNMIITDAEGNFYYHDNITDEKITSTLRLENKLNELNDENEQLKSIIKEVAELLSEEVDLFSDKATEHDINAYVELKELDNKDAYYMAISTKKAIKMLKGDVE